MIECSTVVISQKRLGQLLRIEEILWEVEASLPSGLESWVDDEELQQLREQE